MLNSTQIGILKLAEPLDLTSSKDTIINTFLSLLDQATGGEVVRDKNSNIYILVETFVDKLIETKQASLDFLNNLNSFFDVNKFTGFASGDYYGLKSALMALTYFTDCKIALVKPGIVNIIVLIDNSLVTDSKNNNASNVDATIKKELSKTIHKYLAIGIKTYEDEADKEAVFQEVEASSGQSLKYAFYLAKKRNLNFTVTYFLDYEEDNVEYDMVRSVTNSIQDIYNNYYYVVGKDIKIQDFYSIVISTKGLGRISIKIEELDNSNNVINTFTDIDVEIDTKEIFILNNLTVIAGAN